MAAQAKHLKTYCCCCDSRTATLAGNWVILVAGFLYSMLFIFTFVQEWNEKDPNLSSKQDWPLFIFLLALQVVKITCASFAIYGINHGKRHLVQGTYTFVSLMIMLECVYIIIGIALQFYSYAILIIGIVQFYLYAMPMYAYIYVDVDEEGYVEVQNKNKEEYSLEEPKDIEIV